jgi:hypothetical protein
MGPWLVPGTHEVPCLLPRRESFCEAQTGRDTTSLCQDNNTLSIETGRVRRPRTLPPVVKGSSRGELAHGYWKLRSSSPCNPAAPGEHHSRGSSRAH